MLKHLATPALLCAQGLVLSLAASLAAQEAFPLGADSQPKEGVPQGQILGPFPWQSQIYSGTSRDYWVYVPAQYRAEVPACVMVVQDGLRRAKGWKLPTVMDNLIHAGEMPVTIAILIDPGEVAAPTDKAQPRFNRSFEYDSLGDLYARFLLEEILPEVGKKFNLSTDPNDRSIAGASSGGICAFNVAWERPDEFRRVLSTIGTYVGLRGGNAFPALVRKYEPKPLRIFLEDGDEDLDLYAGSWWVANQDMLAALKFSGYEVEHRWGAGGGHNSAHAASILPDALRWLWRDHPREIKRGLPPVRRTDILITGEHWELVSQGHNFTEGPAVSPTGEVYFTDLRESRIYRVAADGSVSLFAENTSRANGLMFGNDGKLYACADGKQQIVAYDESGQATTVAEGVRCNDLVIGRAATYFTDPGNHKVLRLDEDGTTTVVDEGIERPNGIAFSPDQTQLYVADTRGKVVYSFQVQADGSLAHKQPFFDLHLPPNATTTGADGMTVDRQGRLYVTTQAGLQVCDQLGRVHLILERPQRAWLSNVVFAGPEMDMLYVTCNDKVYRRRVKAQGLRPWDPPIMPPKPSL